MIIGQQFMEIGENEKPHPISSSVNISAKGVLVNCEYLKVEKIIYLIILKIQISLLQ